MKILNIFKKRLSAVDLAVEEILSTGGLKGLAKYQMEAQAREQQKIRKEHIREKYYFYKQQLDNGKVLKADKYDEWIFTKFIIEDYKKVQEDSTLFNSGIPYKEVSINIEEDE